MPLINGKLLTPDEAIAQDRCPETGIDLKGVNIAHHIARTWSAPFPNGKDGDEGRRRVQLLRDWAKTHEHLQPRYNDAGELIE